MPVFKASPGSSQSDSSLLWLCFDCVGSWGFRPSDLLAVSTHHISSPSLFFFSSRVRVFSKAPSLRLSLERPHPSLGFCLRSGCADHQMGRLEQGWTMGQERNLPQEESPAQETLLLGHYGTVQFPYAHPHKLCTPCVCVSTSPLPAAHRFWSGGWG